MQEYCISYQHKYNKFKKNLNLPHTEDFYYYHKTGIKEKYWYIQIIDISSEKLKSYWVKIRILSEA